MSLSLANVNMRAIAWFFGEMFCAGIALLPAAGLAQNLFEADEDSGNIYEFTTNGTQSTFVSGLTSPAGLAFDNKGDLFVACVGGSGMSGGYINEITFAGVQSTFASDLYKPFGLAFNSAGNLFVTCLGNQLTNLDVGEVIEITPAGGLSTFASGLVNPTGLAIDSEGDLFVLCCTNKSPLKPGPLYTGALIKIAPNGTKSTFANGWTNTDMGVAIDSAGNIFVANFSATSGSIAGYTSGGSQFTTFTGLNEPRLMAFDGAGNLFVGNSGNNSIVEIASNGSPTPFASGLDYPAGLAFQPPPPLQAIGASVHAHGFGFTILGSNSEMVVVESCTNLLNPVWLPQATDTLSGESLYFSDPQWTNDSSRYYRLLSP